MNMDTVPQAAKSQCPVSRVKIDTLDTMQQVLRSKAVEENADVSADNYVCPNALAAINVREFQQGNLAMSNGDVHRQRRRLLNSLVRPEQLVRFREDIILPSVDRWMGRMIKRNEDGAFGCDLAGVVELIFLEFAAKIIGIEGVESEEGMARLRGCALPIFGGLSAAHFEDREGVTKAGIEAKKVFVEEFYRPSLEYTRQQLKGLEAGELTEEDVPLNLLQMIATQAHESYADEDVGIKEAILFFVATTGTSVQAVLSTVEYLLDWFEKHPDDRGCIEDMEFVSNALQEALRLRAPFVPFLTRLAVEDLEVSDVHLKAGDEVQAWVARAGRDAAVFGDDANEFNPRREIPEGISRYGLAFATGAHQCLGLRAVLGNDGKSGSHLRLVQGLFRAGIRRDPHAQAQTLPLKPSDDPRDQIPTYISFPVILDNWSPRA
ncbi:cytochrome P450 (plasmid) [Sphingobium sp. SJ10-10]|nr:MULTISPECIES: cytochrome P450 [unclassified Sphingobium]MEC6699596.1 cytochrome P450 [Sphingobium sp. SJ10-10]NML91714.1 cytochrome P450 [Sphingobium sp. TB-6]